MRHAAYTKGILATREPRGIVWNMTLRCSGQLVLDEHLISPENISTMSIKHVMRIKQIINQGDKLGLDVQQNSQN